MFTKVFRQLFLGVIVMLFLASSQMLQAQQLQQMQKAEAANIGANGNSLVFEKTIVVLEREAASEAVFSEQHPVVPANLEAKQSEAVVSHIERTAPLSAYPSAEKSARSGQPNLTPYKPEGWDDKLLVSAQPGTTTEDAVYAGETAYIDYAYYNNGDADIHETFHTELYVNAALVAKGDGRSLPRNSYGYAPDVIYTFPEAGTYTLKFVCDSDGNVTESDESDNVYERNKTITKLGVKQPDFSPYKPTGWDDKIVVSREPGTHTENTVYVGETAYIDYAFRNNGNGNADKAFYVELYINSQSVRQKSSSSLAAYAYGYESDVEYTFSQPGTYTLKLVCDTENSVAESNEADNAYERTKPFSNAGDFNISPYIPENWENIIVVSPKTGTNTSDSIYAGQTAYIDYAYYNKGTADIDNSFYLELYVNGNKVRRAYSAGLKKGYFGLTSDFEHTFSQAGAYTLKLVCDADNNIPESDESDNTYERTITVLSTGGSSVNLTPYKPDNWSDKIALSNKTGTHTDDKIYAGENVYIDYAYVNNGAADIAQSFYTSLYINGVKAATGIAGNGLKQGQYGYAQDFKYVFSQSGTYTLKFVCDSENNVSESDENDNEYQRIVSTVSGGEPDIRIEPSALNFTENQTDTARMNASAASADTVEILQDRTVFMRRGQIHPEAAKSPYPPLTKGEDAEFLTKWEDAGLRDAESEGRHKLLQFGALLSPQDRADLEAQGIRVLKYIPNAAYWVSFKSGAFSEARQSQIAGGIQWSWIPTPEYKMSEAIDRDEFPPNARYADGTVGVYVLIFQDVSKTEAAEAFSSIDPAVQLLEWVSDELASVRTPANFIKNIASSDQVEWVEPAPPPKIALNETAAIRMKADTLKKAPLQLDGKGLTVGIWDGGSVFAHSDFGDRLTVGDEGEVNTHATHVAGTVAGGGLGNSEAAGMAPALLLLSYDWKDDINEMRNAVGKGLVISNHSYGYVTGWYWSTDGRLWKEDDTGFGQYSATAASWDNLVSDTGLIIFKAAGNDRDEGPGCPGDEECDGPYDCIPQQGVSKNVITVGATNDSDGMTDFSSWGPANDGRIKPDLCANGYSVLSTLPDSQYGFMSGTSMATPAASGAAALLYQHFTHITGSAPEPETLKALLIHSATDLGRTGPDYEFGWGLINAQSAADLISQQAWQIGTLSATGAVADYPLAVSADSTELKVTLVWTDPAGSPEAAKALVNDLDLVLTDPNGVRYYPWILDKDKPTVSATTGSNRLDNIEQVLVSNPRSGTWTVSVRGYAVSLGPQHFTVAAKDIRTNTKAFTVYNDGTDTLNISKIDKQGNADWLSFLPAAPFSIEPGKSLSVTVNVNPALAGSGFKSENLRVHSDDPDQNVYAVSVNIASGTSGTELKAADDTAQTLVDTPVAISVSDNDSGDALTVKSVSDPLHGNVAVSTDKKAVIYTPDGGFTGNDTFTYTAGSGTQTAQATVNVTVLQQLVPLKAQNDAAQTAADTAVIIYVLGNDSGPDAGTLTVASVSDPPHGSAVVNADKKTVLYTPDSKFIGQDSFAYTVSNGTGTATAAVSMTVAASPVPLTAADDTAKTNADTPVAIRVLDNDTGSSQNALTVQSVSVPAHGKAIVNTDNKTVRYTPDTAFTGPDSFTYIMSDGSNTSQASVTVTVEASDEVCKTFVSKDTPLSIPDNEGSGLTSNLMISDAGTVRDVNVTVNITHTWTPDVSVYLVSPSDARIALFENVGEEGENFVGTALDDEALQNIEASAAPFTGYFRPASPLSVLDGQTFAGQWKLLVSDTEEFDEGILNSWGLTICYAPSSENRPPQASPDTAVTPHNTPVSLAVTVNDSDLDGDALTVNTVSAPAHGTAVSDDATKKIVYTPAADFSGMDSFTYTLNDGKGGESTAAVSVRVYKNGNLIKDSGFEAGTSNSDWDDQSLLFGVNIYKAPEMAHSGNWLAWFEGGGTDAETGTVAQDVMIPKAEDAVLRFWLRKYLNDVSGTFTVTMDGETLISMTQEENTCREWTELTADVSKFADGNTHRLAFNSSIQVGVGATSFLIDDVLLIILERSESPTILKKALRVLQVLAGMKPENVSGMDISGDGKAGMAEAIYFLQTAAEVR